MATSFLSLAWISLPFPVHILIFRHLTDIKESTFILFCMYLRIPVHHAIFIHCSVDGFVWARCHARTQQMNPCHNGANAGCLVRTYTYSTIASHQMWPLYVTRVAYFEKRLEKATKHQILSILQDSSRELRLSPLVMTIEQDEKDPAWFNITERLPLFAGLESTTTFQCCLTKVDRKTEQGATNDVRAGLGTTMKCEWRVEERDSVQGASPNKELWLSERVEVEVSWESLNDFLLFWRYLCLRGCFS